MRDLPKFLLVETTALPGVYPKVVEAKELIAQGAVKSSSEAVKRVGISRSAFYKYKDRVFRPAKDARQLCTYSFSLKDEPGVLSQLINTVTGCGVNILTINQSIPIDSVAPVTISFRMDGESVSLEQLEREIGKLGGIVEIKRLLGE
ncbi:ACT domain-containing protein [Neobittarella massiliensis]|uniref:ACT domain-containing protein n=2 Tax=Oscillospiraceae TaxID=216572 RepID=A0A8J6IKK6_9FIRM|nr:ACT domain-containing protein [Neobittarella massiliensis]MBC3515154.1 ACT domain-containing protein [Neobittarella massiliensis]SCJ63537.1 ACT domain-containing protein [uncultured Anaerotruncus sp.]